MKVRNPKEGLNSFCCQTSFCHPPPEWELSAGIQGWLRLFKVILPHTPHSTNSHAAQRKRRDIHRHAFAGSQSRQCRASVNPGVKPKNKASQTWSKLVKPKSFSERQPRCNTQHASYSSRTISAPLCTTLDQIAPFSQGSEIPTGTPDSPSLPFLLFDPPLLPLLPSCFVFVHPPQSDCYGGRVVRFCEDPKCPADVADFAHHAGRSERNSALGLDFF